MQLDTASPSGLHPLPPLSLLRSEIEPLVEPTELSERCSGRQTLKATQWSSDLAGAQGCGSPGALVLAGEPYPSEDVATSRSVSRLEARKQLVLARDVTEEEDNDLGCPLPALDQPSVLDLLETVLRVVDPDDQVACTWLCSSSSFTCPVGNAARSGRPELMREAEYKGVFVGLVYIKAANACQEQTTTYGGLPQILLQYVVYSLKVS